MPDLLDDLRRLGGPDRPPPDSARRHALARLQRELDLEPAATRPARLRLGLVTGIAAGVAVAVAAGSALMPSHGPGAREVLQRAVAAVSPDRTEIVVADIQAQQLQGSHVVSSYGTRRVWARQVPGQGTREFRLLQLTDATGSAARKDDESVSYPSPSSAADARLPFDTEEYSATSNRVVVSTGVQSNIGPELFQARVLLAKARDGDGVKLNDATVNGRPAYRLTWTEDTSRAPNDVTVELTLWVDRETYAPLRYTDHSHGTDAQGQPLDQTYKATISGFEQLPDTAANRKQLEMSPHPDARRVSAGDRPWRRAAVTPRRAR
jgi:hypothetical protein